MGQNKSFTKEQRYVIDKIKQEPVLLSSFYFTGGTALSYLYLQHRHSEDLDFFSEKKLDIPYITEVIRKWAENGDFIFTSRFPEIVYIFNLTFKNGVPLKVDFGHYPYQRVEKGILYEGIHIDSKLDIAINKLATINQRTAVKDFVDLYFLLKEFTLWDLIEGVRIKFNMKMERFILASDFMKVNDFNKMPEMIVPLTLDELKSFYTKLAREMAMTVIE